MLITTVVSYDRAGVLNTSFPPIHNINRTTSVYTRVDRQNNEIQTITHTSAGGSTRVHVVAQIYDRNLELHNLYPQKNSIDLLI
jgi:hypothetical protein